MSRVVACPACGKLAFVPAHLARPAKCLQCGAVVWEPAQGREIDAPAAPVSAEDLEPFICGGCGGLCSGERIAHDGQFLCPACYGATQPAVTPEEPAANGFFAICSACGREALRQGGTERAGAFVCGQCAAPEHAPAHAEQQVDAALTGAVAGARRRRRPARRSSLSSVVAVLVVLALAGGAVMLYRANRPNWEAGNRPALVAAQAEAERPAQARAPMELPPKRSGEPATQVAVNPPVTSPPVEPSVPAPTTRESLIAPVTHAPLPAEAARPQTGEPVVIAPSQPPATKSATRAVDEAEQMAQVINRLLQEANNALGLNSPEAALEALRDARALIDRQVRDKKIRNGGDTQLAVAHGLAVAYLELGKVDQASHMYSDTPLDAACTAPTATRAMVINRAVLDCQQGITPMRTVKRIRDYLQAHPEEADEVMLDLLFTALSKSAEKVTNRTMLDDSMRAYDTLNAKLEKSRTGQRRWGVEWITAGAYAERKRERDSTLKAYADAEANLKAAWARLNIADEELSKARAGQLTGNSVYLQRAARSQQIAQADVDRAQSEVTRTLADVPALSVLDALALNKHLQPPLQVASAAATPADESVPTPANRPATAIEPGSHVRPPAALPPVAAVRKNTFTRQAAAFPVAPDLFITAGVVGGASRVMLEGPDGSPLEATVERADVGGLALLRIKGTRVPYFNFATQFAGGAVRCPAYPEVALFDPVLKNIPGSARAPEANWRVRLDAHPRLSGSPLLDQSGNVAGVAMAGDRDTEKRPSGYELSAITVQQVQSFLKGDLPSAPCANSAAAAVMQATATFSK